MYFVFKDRSSSNVPQSHLSTENCNEITLGILQRSQPFGGNGLKYSPPITSDLTDDKCMDLRPRVCVKRVTSSFYGYLGVQTLKHRSCPIFIEEADPEIIPNYSKLQIFRNGSVSVRYPLKILSVLFSTSSPH